MPTNKRNSIDCGLPDAASTLNDEQLRLQIYANAAVLFPSTPSPQHSQQHSSSFEIVFALCPVCSADGQVNTPAQYALLVRRGPSGEYVPLLKGEAFNHTTPWSKPLRSLFNASAKAIHLKFATVRLPLLGQIEELPRYESTVSSVTQ